MTGRSATHRLFTFRTAILVAATAAAANAAPTVPTEIQQPGTQPGQVATFTSPDNCDNCHGGYAADPNIEPAHGWRGGMMAHASRDPLFWATMAVAEQDFLPGDPATRGGAGDLCLRCHTPNGWIAGRSTPTNGSGLSTTNDIHGVECEFCHLMTDPDPLVSVDGTTEVQSPPFEAYDPVTGEAYRGSGQYVLNGNGTRLGPFATNPPHAVLKSPFFRSGDFCGTCHDVSNAAVGDLAPEHGAQVPLLPGTYSGVVGTPVTEKAAFRNPPYRYGVVERTSSEWIGGALDTFRVNDYATLPPELRAPGGALDVAFHRAWDAREDADYEDGAPRFYTCQTCHMSAATGKGCNKNGFPVRTDLPRHDLTGAGHWMPDALVYMDAEGTLRIGGGLSQTQRDALLAGKGRAIAMIQSAATISASAASGPLAVRVTNLTGHKLISGYPEGRRLWIAIRWYDAEGALVAEDGAYGPTGRTVLDRDGVPHQVASLLDPADTVVYEAHPGMSQAWAQKLVSLGYPPAMPLGFDPATDAVTRTLGELAASPPGSAAPTFHFVLNDTVIADNRIPPYGFSYDVAMERNTLPVPSTQYGDPGPGGVFDHAHERTFAIPGGAVRAEVSLHYQETSWEYIHFLWKANDGLDPFLGNEGRNLLDAWLNTGMAAPVLVASTTATFPASPPRPGESSPPPQQMTAARNPSGAVDIAFAPACSATNHTVYHGDLARVSELEYTGAACNVGATGAATFDPGSGNAFFVIVGNNGVSEGTYGTSSSGIERPEDIGTAGCDLPQDLGPGCAP